METNNSYTVSTLNTQLAHARNMMIAAGMPGLRLTRSCEDDVALARKIEDTCPFQGSRTALVLVQSMIVYAETTATEGPEAYHGDDYGYADGGYCSARDQDRGYVTGR
jgi:hypothetical protein